MQGLEGFSAVVTGGAQGIGKAITAALAEAGMHVVILDADEQACRETEQELSRPHSTVLAFAGDAANETDLRSAVAASLKLGKGLRAAVANTGISVYKPVTELSLEEWNRVLAVNLTSGFLLAKLAAENLARRDGAMVLVGSSRALMSEPHWEAYGASKGGVVALAHALAVSLGPRVRVNCVSPGWIATDAWQRSDKRREPELKPEDHTQHPAGRVGTPPDIARLVRFLLSDDAGFITGAHYLADGGMTRKMIYV